MVPLSLLALVLSYWLPRTFEQHLKKESVQLYGEDGITDWQEDVELLSSQVNG